MLWLWLACLVPSEEVEHALDPDEDGFGPEEDCGPMDATVYPGAEEVCGDGVVNDCSATEDDARTECRLQGLMSLAQADLRMLGESAEDSAGFSVSSAGDIDLDGRDELLIGAPGLNNFGLNDGGAYVVHPESNTNKQDNTVSLQSSTFKLLGEDGGGFAGHVVSGGQDVDGDGRADLLVGARGGGDADLRQGETHLILSHRILEAKSSVLNMTAIDVQIIGESSADDAGWSISLARDVDGDGRSDVLVGARYADLGGTNSGAAYLVLSSGALDLDSSRISLGVADKTIVGEVEHDEAAFILASVGDVDGDGLEDVLVGSPGHDVGESNTGAAYLLMSSGTLLFSEQAIDLSTADRKFIGEGIEGQAGRAVAGAGDVDGDGYADLLIGAPYLDYTADEEGAAYVLFAGSIAACSAGTISLSSADRKFVGESSGDSAGWSVAGVGDVDGDGRGDSLVGAKYHATGGSGAGAAYLLLSSGALSASSTTTSLSDADLKLVGESAGDYAGHSVSTAGDVNGDGLDDLLIGAPNNNAGGLQAGAAYLLFGRSF